MLILALLLGTVVCDVAGQLCFKLGVTRSVESAMPATGNAGFLLGTVPSPWVAAGVLIYVVEFTIWFAALSMAPLSVAFPFMALSYCGVVIASRFVLGEHVSGRRWLATLVVAAGVALVCWP
jgi:undecaprenyl phosphate-alpha-L-ara4N flippase subunit ArnE